MTSAVYRNGTPSLSIPQTQNTAPVLEFNCLYTHDLRRKAKRWQDGFLRYHTFNRRIMVYDVPRNLVGDVHWTAGEALQDGDEVMLEKDGVMVQVSEAVGRTETDLTGLLNSRKKVSSERGSSPPARGPQTPAPRTINASMARPPTQLKHRSLNALLGTPKGPIGKAAMSKSPFELRHEDLENHGWEGGRPPKRQRMDRPPARDISEPSIQPARPRKAGAAPKRTRAPLSPAQQPQAQEVIALREDEPEPERFLPDFSSNALAPLSSSPGERPAAKKLVTAARSSSPGFQTQKAPLMRAEAPEAHVTRKARILDSPVGMAVEQALETPQPRSLNSQEPKSKYHVATRPAKQTSREAGESPEDHVVLQRTGFEHNKAGATLRVESGARKKNILLCQDQLTSKPKRVSSTDTNDAADTLLGAAVDESGDELPKTKARTQRQLLDERLARINAKQRRGDTLSIERTAAHVLPADQTPKVGFSRLERNASLESDAQHRALEDSALELAKLDAMITAPRSAAIGSTVQATPNDVKSISPRKKKGVGRREVRASAQSCFPESSAQSRETGPAAPAAMGKDLPPEQETQQFAAKPEPTPNSPRKHSRPFIQANSGTEQMAVTKLKRTPGAPMRFTPSPQKRTVATNNPNQANGAPNHAAQPPPQAKPAAKPTNNTRGKKPPQPALRLDTTASGTAAVLLGRPFQPLRSASESRSPRSAEAVEAKPDP
ncbi:hypothetical protein LTR91_013656 [Friedmanniomyces endolithicus]|uniref:5'-3' DNA helicase ZGRF1-like N-terminal domain-containing protein n=1 Tax=Friedmanniomyces endolithicus TaxID=329885 RepID=A0AAN6KD15_9PEZI|nr:hypothetical protein LTR38_008600 [Friedmanniomyces endolithicus]KAK0805629.1 hypothetical protein LTR75_007301 [Friedmanniomyces endolithicus]KAK0811417.1 hypothetical protein LTR59_001870 [Friedmanniomyces endolithicus]KAK0843156.1 hypothetical protein LTR03_008812 [Friedmanniomyces endolithicus]KAK0871847.1 hypothetical protein LTS02_001644 [Friedmanniomyces endolithicus]